MQRPGFGGLGVVALLSVGTWYLVRPGAGARDRTEEASKSTTIEGVVEESRPQIRECWNRALSTRAPGAFSGATRDPTTPAAIRGEPADVERSVTGGGKST